jgi:hypothetical protein
MTKPPCRPRIQLRVITVEQVEFDGGTAGLMNLARQDAHSPVAPDVVGSAANRETNPLANPKNSFRLAIWRPLRPQSVESQLRALSIGARPVLGDIVDVSSRPRRVELHREHGADWCERDRHTVVVKRRTQCRVSPVGLELNPNRSAVSIASGPTPGPAMMCGEDTCRNRFQAKQRIRLGFPTITPVNRDSSHSGCAQTLCWSQGTSRNSQEL